MDFEQILAHAEESKGELFSFLRDIVAIESFDGGEGAVIQRIRQEMEKVGFDRIEIDPMGNLLGYLGHGKHLIAMDAHIDTVTFGDRSNWTFDPFLGMEDEETIGGLGATDQKGGMASMIYAAKIIRELHLEDDYTLLVTGTVMEENGDGLCWQYIIEQDGVRPEFAVLTEPSDGCIRQGQRGRMEIWCERRASVVMALRRILAQRGLSNGADHCGGRTAQRTDDRRRNSWQRQRHYFGNILHIPVEMRRCGQLYDFD